MALILSPHTDAGRTERKAWKGGPLPRGHRHAPICSLYRLTQDLGRQQCQTEKGLWSHSTLSPSVAAIITFARTISVETYSHYLFVAISPLSFQTRYIGDSLCCLGVRFLCSSFCYSDIYPQFLIFQPRAELEEKGRGTQCETISSYVPSSRATMLLESQHFSSPPGVDSNPITHPIEIEHFCPRIYQHLSPTLNLFDGVADRTRQSIPQTSSISAPVPPDHNHSNEHDPEAPSSSRRPYNCNALYRLRRPKSF